MLRLILIIGSFAVLAACSTLDETECKTADWYQIGYEDGTNGKASSHFSRHVKACQKHGVMPKRAPWEEGRNDGLRIFCVPERAYQIGRNGGRFPAVCTAQESIEMRPAYDWGQSYYDFARRIAELESDIDDRNDAIDSLEDPDDPIIGTYLLYNFQDRQEIRRLKRRQERYASWPPRR